MTVSIERELALLRRLTGADEPELAMVGLFVAPGSLALDIGGHIGLYTLAMLDAGAGVKVFECRMEAADRLRVVFADAPVEVFAIAASNCDAPGTLFVPMLDDRAVGARASLEAHANGGAALLPRPTPRGRIDSFGFNDVSLIKVDVEGHEAAVLRGAAQTIARNRPVLLVEIEERHHPGESTALLAEVAAWDYRPWYLHRGTLRRAGGFDFARFQSLLRAKQPDGGRHPDYVNNFIFLPAEREATLIEGLAGCVADFG